MTLGISPLRALRKFFFTQKLSYVHTFEISPNIFTDWYSIKDSRGLLRRPLSLLSSLLSRILSGKFYSLMSPQTPNVCLFSQQDHCSLLGFPLPALYTENDLWAESWAGLYVFILYVSLLSGTLSPMMPVVQGLKTVIFLSSFSSPSLDH